MTTFEITIDPALLSFTVIADSEDEAEQAVHEAVSNSMTIDKVQN